MTMTPYNGDIHQALKWLQNKAPNIQSIVDQKANWYNSFNDQFWVNWEINVFDLKTVNPFGVMVWCIILGVPSAIFGLYQPNETSWAFGENRQNFIYSGTETVADPNTLGGNFFGGGNTTIVDIQEARWALMLRYVSLVSNGRISFINEMLRWIFNNGAAWDFPGKRYFYAIDSTAPAQTLVPTAVVTTPLYIEYRVGANLIFSSQFMNILNSPGYGIIPSCAGSSYAVIQES